MKNEIDGSDRSSDVPNYHDWSLFESVEARPFDPAWDFTKHPFIQPDGTPIGVSYPSRGTRRIHFYGDKRFCKFKPFANRNKDHSACHAKLELWTGPARRQFFICVDFDSLPQQTYRQVNVWGSGLVQYQNPHEIKRMGYKVLAQRFQQKIGNHGIVFNSVRNHYPKILLLLEYEEPVKRPVRADILTLLNTMFPEYMEDSSIDLQKVAFSTTFVPWEDNDILRERLRGCVPITISKRSCDISFGSESEQITVPSSFRYMMNSKLPKSMREKGDTQGYIRFKLCLCAMARLARDKGFAISQIAMARTLGVAPTTVSKYIRKAKKLFLDVLDERYVPKKAAKRYEAKGELKKFLVSKINAKRSIKPPKRIKDGDWHATLTRVAPMFKHNPDGIVRWAKGIPGYNKKDRLYQAIRFKKWLTGLVIKDPLSKRQRA